MTLSDLSLSDLKTIRFYKTCTRYETDEIRLERQAQQIAEFEANGGKVEVIPIGVKHLSDNPEFNGKVVK